MHIPAAPELTDSLRDAIVKLNTVTSTSDDVSDLKLTLKNAADLLSALPDAVVEEALRPKLPNVPGLYLTHDTGVARLGDDHVWRWERSQITLSVLSQQESARAGVRRIFTADDLPTFTMEELYRQYIDSSKNTVRDIIGDIAEHVNARLRQATQ